jgi:ubiquinone/menaquinone biosynthesis C-methylase UbiE
VTQKQRTVRRETKEDDMLETADRNPTHRTTGLVLRWAVPYDLLLWLVLRGKEKSFRERLVQLARLGPGERVLDIGCGTGTLAIAAKRHIGTAGTVCGVDASPEMIARARKKAARAGVEVEFSEGIVEALPFPYAHFDVVLSTVMLHHLGPELRRQCASEVRRVLKPGGRWFVVDFEGSARQAGGILSRFHRHGHIKPGDLGMLTQVAGFSCVESAPVGFRNLHFVLAAAPRNG